MKSIAVSWKRILNYQVLEAKYNVMAYFCHVYSPEERGSNEYFDHRLRWFFPKRTNFSQITEDTLLESLDLINNHPLKINQLQTAIEKFRACSD